jgi:hypothetical protein
MPEIGKVILSEVVLGKFHTLVDWVSLEINLNHTAASDLGIYLLSPKGTKSIFALPRTTYLSGIQVLKFFLSVIHFITHLFSYLFVLVIFDDNPMKVQIYFNSLSR